MLETDTSLHRFIVHRKTTKEWKCIGFPGTPIYFLIFTLRCFHSFFISLLNTFKTEHWCIRKGFSIFYHPHSMRLYDIFLQRLSLISVKPNWKVKVHYISKNKCIMLKINQKPSMVIHSWKSLMVNCIENLFSSWSSIWIKD